MTYTKLLMLVAFLLALISFGSRLEAKPKYRDRVKPKVQKIKKKKRYQRRDKRSPKYQLKRRPKKGFINPEIYKKQQEQRRKEKLKKEKKMKEEMKRLRERREAQRKGAKAKRTLRKNFQVKPKIKSKIPKPQPKVKENLNRNTPKIHKNPKKPLTKRKKCNKICRYHKLRFMMLLEAANDYGDSHYIEKGGFNNRTTIKKRKKK